MQNFRRDDLFVGIDLGTTNSVIATCSLVNGLIKTPVKNVERFGEINPKTGKGTQRLRDALLPSYVSYMATTAGDYDVYVGDIAKRQYNIKPWTVAKSIKSYMGQSNLDALELQAEIPDKNPEAVSARILKHLLSDVEKHFDCAVKNVVITVPANFNPAMRQATIRAAEKAGISQTEGNIILLSEPEAVMYDLLNQIKQGDFDANIDFSQKRNVLIFDIGGGTLDITLHEVETSKEDENIINMKAIATNRYSNIAGDTFDKKIAEELYKKYLNYYEKQSLEVAKKIKTDKYALANLTTCAENLKINISARYYDNANLSDDEEFEVDCTMSNGYSFDDVISKAEFDRALKPLLGCQYQYQDYQKFAQIHDDGNIIYPILDVLQKAATKLNTENFKVDAVVMNGGMSRLYLIQERLKEFFGIKPISVADPDKSVAQGAVIYHYHLFKQSSIMEKLREKNKVGQEEIWQVANSSQLQPAAFIKSGANILNEALYLGLKGGATHLLVKAGENLPYASEIIEGFSISKNQKCLSIPIKQVSGISTEYQTIAAGNILFSKKYNTDTPVAIRFSLDKNQILALEAWTADQYNPQKIMERGRVEIAVSEAGAAKVGKGVTTGIASKILPKMGTDLIVLNEISALKDLCNKAIRTGKNLKLKSHVAGQIKQKRTILASCGNPKDFAKPILKTLSEANNDELKLNLLVVARRMAKNWSKLEQEKLTNYCEEVIKATAYQGNIFGLKINICIEAINTMGIYGNAAQLEYLGYLQHNHKFTNALLYAYGMSRTNTSWILEQLKNKERLQESFWALGMCLQRKQPIEGSKLSEQAVEKILQALQWEGKSREMLNMGIVALGLICDQRAAAEQKLGQLQVALARNFIEDNINSYTKSASNVALAMLKGLDLDLEAEKYLLGIMAKQE